MNKETDKLKNEKLSFLMNSLKRRLYKENDILCSNKVGEKGIELILNNDFMGALQYFKQAINADPSDARHYLNNSYCYLNLKKYALALADASHVLKKSNVPAYLFIANLRAGQAAAALREYKKAESFFQAAISIDLDNPYPKRELMRLRITSLVEAGYSERDALSKIEMAPVTTQITSYFTDDLKVQNDSQILHNPMDDDLVYQSDDDESSNFKILNRILKYEPGKLKLKHVANKLSTVSKKNTVATTNNSSETKNSTNTPKQNSSILNSPSQQAKDSVLQKESPLYFDNIKPLEMPKPHNKNYVVNPLAVWVGNLSNEIPNSMLRVLFSQYGIVTHVHRPVSANYAFVHFSNEKSVKEVLQYDKYNLHGYILTVRAYVSNR